VALALPQGDVAFREWVNRFIDQEKASGSLRRLIEKNGLDATFLVD
jgi:ABC-type amino acid transport substrate-binding protein